MEGEQRKRAVNFSAKEENILVSLVKKYQDKIECRKTDTMTNRDKILAWKQLSNDFNLLCGETFRDFKTLRSKYENIKKKSKKKYAEEKRYNRGTGGGPSKEIHITDTDNAVKEILGTQMIGLISRFDMDSPVVEYNDSERENRYSDTFTVMNHGAGESSTNAVVISEPDIMPESNPGISARNKISDWSSFTPAKLRTPVSEPLSLSYEKNKISNIRRTKRKPLTDKLSLWAASKKENVELQKKLMLEEHNLKLKQMEERHLQMMRTKEEEHNKRMELLEIEKQILLKKL